MTSPAPVDWKALDALYAKRKPAPFDLEGMEIEREFCSRLVNAYPALRSMAGGEGEEDVAGKIERVVNAGETPCCHCWMPVASPYVVDGRKYFHFDCWNSRQPEAPLPKPPASGAQP